MRLVTYSQGPVGAARVGVRVGHRVLDIELASRVDGEPLPNTMKTLLREGRGALSRVQALAKAAQVSAGRFSGAMHEERAIRFLPPVPDADTFIRGGAVARLAENLAGHNTKVAIEEGRVAGGPEMVFVIGRPAGGIGADSDPLDYVFGVTVLHDLGNATVTGPEIVTLDDVGDAYDLWLTCAVNGEERVRMNTGEQVHRLGDVLLRVARGTSLEPGDLVCAGKPGPETLALKPGDVVESSIEGVTTLRTTLTPE